MQAGLGVVRSCLNPVNYALVQFWGLAEISSTGLWHFCVAVVLWIIALTSASPRFFLSCNATHELSKTNSEGAPCVNNLSACVRASRSGSGSGCCSNPTTPRFCRNCCLLFARSRVFSLFSCDLLRNGFARRKMLSGIFFPTNFGGEDATSLSLFILSSSPLCCSGPVDLSLVAFRRCLS